MNYANIKLTLAYRIDKDNYRFLNGFKSGGCLRCDRRQNSNCFGQVYGRIAGIRKLKHPTAS